ncbi:MAG: hypothetical protein QE271_02135 [Bacteriovoracaceae bacterium]|nr:hypothetical protein [Bacteriovoracaceae bacterium]
MDEIELIRKLKLIEALHQGSTTAGEKMAASEAIRRIQDRLNESQAESRERVVEYKFGMSDEWNRKLFKALLRRYGVEPYRYERQRHTTVMAKVSKRFVDDELWPQYLEMSKVLETYLTHATDRIISEAVHKDNSEAKVVAEPDQLPFFEN